MDGGLSIGRAGRLLGRAGVLVAVGPSDCPIHGGPVAEWTTATVQEESIGTTFGLQHKFSRFTPDCEHEAAPDGGEPTGPARPDGDPFHH